MIVRKGKSLGIAFLKGGDIAKTFLKGERLRFTEEVAIDVHADDPIVPCRVTSEPSIQHTRPAPNFENYLARARLRRIDRALHHAEVAARAPARFQHREKTQFRTAKRDRPAA